MKTQLRMGLILVSALLLLLPGAYGLTLSMGIADAAGGAFGSLQVNAGLETSFASKMEACPEYYSSFMTADGKGKFDFDETFHSLDNGEHVRLIAGWSDSDHYSHNHAIELQENGRIRASQQMTVDQGKDIQSSAQAWNSLEQSFKVGIKIPAGSLQGYSNYGDAMDESVTAGQAGIVSKGTKFTVSAETKSKYSLQRSSSTVRSSRDVKAETTGYVDLSRSTIRSKMKTV
jgi:hypothetical protein